MLRWCFLLPKFCHCLSHSTSSLQGFHHLVVNFFPLTTNLDDLIYKLGWDNDDSVLISYY